MSNSISVQVMISWFLGSSLKSDSELTAWNLLGVLCLPLPCSCTCALVLSHSLKINKLLKHCKKKKKPIDLRFHLAHTKVYLLCKCESKSKVLQIRHLHGFYLTFHCLPFRSCRSSLTNELTSQLTSPD